MSNRIREIRKSKHMTLKELGDIIGAASNTISQYEMGRRGLNHDILLKLSSALNVSVDELLGVPSPAEEKGTPSAVSSEDDALKKKIDQLSDSDRLIVSNLVDSFLARGADD